MSIRSVLVRSGYNVTAVCSTGTQALAYMEEWDNGIVLCGYSFRDMGYGQLFEYLRPGFQMLVITSPQHCGEISSENLLYLPMPFKPAEILRTVEMMEREFVHIRRKLRNQPKVRGEKEMTLITDTKHLLMEHYHMTEDEAHRYLQKTSMDSGMNLTDTAQMLADLINKDMESR